MTVSLPNALLPRALRLAAVLALTLAAAACSGKTDELAGGAGGPGGAGGYGRGGPATPGSAQEFAHSVGDRVFFESDQTDLTPTAVATLDKQAQWLSRYPRYTFLIEGHADERGTREYNIALGARRAQSVRDFLARNGVSAARIRTISYGKERPVAVCNDISCWSQNRRAQTVLNNRGGGA